MLQRDHTATQHAVSYREGTSVGNGCGVRGQSEGEEEDRKTIKSQRRERGLRETFSGEAIWKQILHESHTFPNEFHYCHSKCTNWLIPQLKWKSHRAAAHCQDQDAFIEGGKQQIHQDESYDMCVCVSCNVYHLAFKRSGRFLQAHLPGLRNWGTVHHLLVLYWLINRYRVYCRSPERVCKSF